MDVVRELERAGRVLREESGHPLFPDRPVPTCHGVLGPFGEHPSGICGMVRFLVRAPLDEAAVRRALEPGLAEYVAQYGDKTKVADPATGRPKVERHYDLARSGRPSRAHGLGEHGAHGEHPRARRRDHEGRLHAGGGVAAAARLRGGARVADDPDPLVLEGGQGFLPTHGIDEVESRVRGAAELAWQEARRGFAYAGPAPVVSFDKLHNDAFDGDPDSRAMRSGLLAARVAGIEVPPPVTGFRASCDARLFAREYPQKPVITTGPGSITAAHGEAERIDLAELARSSAFLALYILLLTGSIGEAGRQ